MKKAVLFASFLLFSVILLACASKSTENTQLDLNIIENTSELLEPVGAEQNTSIEPPKVLIFSSLIEYQKFASSVEMEDDEFLKYIQENSFDMNGIASKENVKDTLSFVETVPFPKLSGYKLSQFMIYPDKHECYILYEKNDSQRCSFLYQRDNSADIQKYLNDNSGILSVELEKSSEMHSLFDVSKTDAYKSDSPEENNAYYAIIDEEYVLIRTYGVSRDTISSFAADISFVSVDEFSKAE